MRRKQNETMGSACRQWAMPGFMLLIAGLVVGAPAIAADYHSTEVTVTAYNGVRSQTQGHPTTGAWGEQLGPHTVAVSSDLVARGLDDGTTVAIEGFKHDFVVRDKTASRLHNTIDIYMGQNVDKAREFGKQRRRIWWHSSKD